MSPPVSLPRSSLLVPRCGCQSNGFNTCTNEFDDNCNDDWNSWGRWVFFGLFVVGFILVAVGFACLNSRRRRRNGLAPRYGTGWAANGFGRNRWGGGGDGYGQAAPPYNQNAPPVYAQQTGNTFNSNDGYYGQQNGIPLQEPQHSYQPNGNTAPARTKN